MRPHQHLTARLRAMNDVGSGNLVVVQVLEGIAHTMGEVEFREYVFQTVLQRGISLAVKGET